MILHSKTIICNEEDVIKAADERTAKVFFVRGYRPYVDFDDEEYSEYTVSDIERDILSDSRVPVFIVKGCDWFGQGYEK